MKILKGDAEDTINAAYTAVATVEDPRLYLNLLEQVQAFNRAIADAQLGLERIIEQTQQRIENNENASTTD